MSAVEQVAEAHRLERERGYGARRVAAELGISREAAAGLLAAPDPAGQDPRIDTFTAAITGMVPGAIAANVTVTITHRYTRAGRHHTDTWTGRPQRVAECAVEALDKAEGAV